MLTVIPVPVVITAPFAITSVSTLSCSPVGGRINISFAPQYTGTTGQPISFSVVNELLPTTEPGPYTLSLYTDNPVITLKAAQTGSATEASFVYNWLAACQTSEAPNTPPRVVTPLSQQTATVSQGFAYVIPANTFTDQETPLMLSLSAQGIPDGLSFTGAILSGTPSTTVGSPFSVTFTATDAGGLSVSTELVLVVLPASSPVEPTAPFAITGVTTLSCTPVGDRMNLSFAPNYAGLTGQAVAFEVVNELLPTTSPVPYSLSLYRDNPIITLRATQSGSANAATFSYNWLAACSSLGQDNTPPRVNSPVSNQTATVNQPFSLNLANTFADQETPNGLNLSVTGLPDGLTLLGTTLSGTPSASGVSTITLMATDPGSLTASTSFTLTVQPAGSVFGISGVQTVSCEVLSTNLRKLTFSPQYTGVSGEPISFSVVNEKLPTINPGPYSLNLYTDNPIITLSAQQGMVTASYTYSWLTACPSGARRGASEEDGLRVNILGNPIEGQLLDVEVSGVAGQRVRFELVDLKGYPLHSHQIEQATLIERVRLRADALPAVFLVQVSTAAQRQTVKVIKSH